MRSSVKSSLAYSKGSLKYTLSTSLVTSNEGFEAHSNFAKMVVILTLSSFLEVTELCLDISDFKELRLGLPSGT